MRQPGVGLLDSNPSLFLKKDNGIGKSFNISVPAFFLSAKWGLKIHLLRLLSAPAVSGTQDWHSRTEGIIVVIMEMVFLLYNRSCK